jgi:hypothetical protein
MTKCGGVVGVHTAEDMAQMFSVMPLSEQIKFITYVARFLGKDAEEAFTKLISEMLKYVDRYKNMDDWMEARFRKKFTLTPKAVASLYRNYSGMNSKMMPLLIVRAQRAKKRVRENKRYQKNKEDKYERLG